MDKISVKLDLTEQDRAVLLNAIALQHNTIDECRVMAHKALYPKATKEFEIEMGILKKYYNILKNA